MARGGKAVAERESVYSRLSHYLPLAIAIYLLAAPDVPIAPLNDRFVPLALWPVRLGAALTFAGLAFAVWARIRIAGNWSSDVTLKHDHELLSTAPIACVRHPIYTGIPARPGRNGAWRSASGAACSPSLSPRGLLAQAQDRGGRDARAVRRCLRALRRACAGVDSVRALSARASRIQRPVAVSSSAAVPSVLIKRFRGHRLIFSSKAGGHFSTKRTSAKIRDCHLTRFSPPAAVITATMMSPVATSRAPR